MFAAALGFTVSLGCTWLLTRARMSGWVTDHPNHRSLHDTPIPRTGGLAILAALVTCGAVPWITSGGHIERSAVLLVCGAGLVAAVSLADDIRGVGAGLRVVTHLVAASLVVAAGLRLDRIDLPIGSLELPGILGIATTVLFVAWMINLYNFMDGIDGVAGGMGVVGFGTVAGLAFIAGDATMQTSSLCVAAACAAFLVFNYPPARIFLGDAGSTTLGYLAAVVIVGAASRGSVPVWIGVLIFAPFVVDASITLARRVLRGERFWEAHHSHYYQRLARSGWGHGPVARLEYGLMAVSSAAALISMGAPRLLQLALLFGTGGLYAGVFLWIDRKAGFP